MNNQIKTLNTYFWNVGNDIADIRLLAEGALALYEGDASPLHPLGMRNHVEILQMRNDGHTMQEIADKVGYKTPSAVKKRIEKIAAAYTDFISAEYSDFLDTHTQ